MTENLIVCNSCLVSASGGGCYTEGLQLVQCCCKSKVSLAGMVVGVVSACGARDLNWDSCRRERESAIKLSVPRMWHIMTLKFFLAVT